MSEQHICSKHLLINFCGVGANASALFVTYDWHFSWKVTIFEE